MTTDVQRLAAQLFEALGVNVACGSITFNMNESQIDSIETKVKVRVPRHEKRLTSRPDACRLDMNL